MAIKCISKNKNLRIADVSEFVCDTDEDIESLPIAATGSTALVVASGRIFMVNASGEWKPFGEA